MERVIKTSNRKRLLNDDRCAVITEAEANIGPLFE
jgi:hypothetical protein